MGKQTEPAQQRADYLNVLNVAPPDMTRKRKIVPISEADAGSSRQAKKADVGTSKQAAAPKKAPGFKPPPATRKGQPSSPIVETRGKEVRVQSSPEVNTLPKGLIWTSGLVEELENGLLPPRRYYEPTEFTSEEVKNLHHMETVSIKTASLIHALIGLNRKYAKLHGENSDLKNKMAASDQKVEEASKKVEAANAKTQGALKAEEVAKQKLADALKGEEVAKQKLKDALKRAEEAEKRALDAQQSSDEALTRLREKTQLLQELEEENDQLAAKAQSSITALRAALAASVDGSFANAIDQIRYFHPELSINESLLHPRACIVDGKLVPPPAPAAAPAGGEASPEGVSVNRLTQDPRNEAGDDVSSQAPK